MKNRFATFIRAITKWWTALDEVGQEIVLKCAGLVFWVCVALIGWHYAEPRVNAAMKETREVVDDALDKVSELVKTAGLVASGLNDLDYIDNTTEAALEHSLTEGSVDYEFWRDLLLCFHPEAKTIAVEIDSRHADVNLPLGSEESDSSLTFISVDQTLRWHKNGRRFRSKIKFFAEYFSDPNGKEVTNRNAYIFEHDGSPRPMRYICSGRRLTSVMDADEARSKADEASQQQETL